MILTLFENVDLFIVVELGGCAHATVHTGRSEETSILRFAFTCWTILLATQYVFLIFFLGILIDQFNVKCHIQGMLWEYDAIEEFLLLINNYHVVLFRNYLLVFKEVQCHFCFQPKMCIQKTYSFPTWVRRSHSRLSWGVLRPCFAYGQSMSL